MSCSGRCCWSAAAGASASTSLFFSSISLSLNPSRSAFHIPLRRHPCLLPQPLSLTRIPPFSRFSFLHSPPPPPPHPPRRQYPLHSLAAIASPGAVPLLQDAGATALVLAGAYTLVFTFDTLTQHNFIQQNLSRKLVHVLSGLLFAISWPIFSTSTEARYFACLVPLINCLRLVINGLSLTSDQAIIKSVTRQGNPEELLRGPLYYVLILILCALLFWRESPTGLISLAMMCGGDGVADIMGRRFGSTKLPYNQNKSWAGSISMFLCGFFISMGMLYYYSALGYFQLDWSWTMQRVALVAFAATVVESLPITERADRETMGDVNERGEEKLDAGALFVLKSRGSWLHCGYHFTTSIVAPALLSLPYALSLMGWFPGVLCLTFAALVTFYSYNLLSVVLEHYAQLGQRQLRFRDMANDILGAGWGRYFVGPIQFGVCYGAVVACILLGGQSLKYMYLLSSPEGTMKLYQFVAIFGILMLVLAQIPSFHSLRHISLISLVLSLAYSACATSGSIYIGFSENAPAKSYSVRGSGQDRVFGAFNAISIIATTYGNGIIPEIQATIAPPVKGKMFKGLLLCYAIVISTFFSVAISGYWAFGNQAKGTVLMNFLVDEKPLLPTWVLMMINSFTLLQVAAVSVVYLQPTNEVLERKFADAKDDQFSIRNVLPRLVFRSLSVVIATTVAAMFPFFGDINAVIGAFGFMPLDFIFPVVFYNVTFKPSKRGLIFWGNTLIAVIFSALGLLGIISSIRQIVLDANTYSLFANV